VSRHFRFGITFRIANLLIQTGHKYSLANGAVKIIGSCIAAPAVSPLGWRRGYSRACLLFIDTAEIRAVQIMHDYLYDGQTTIGARVSVNRYAYRHKRDQPYHLKHTQLLIAVACTSTRICLQPTYNPRRHRQNPMRNWRKNCQTWHVSAEPCIPEHNKPLFCARDVCADHRKRLGARRPRRRLLDAQKLSQSNCAKLCMQIRRRIPSTTHVAEQSCVLAFRLSRVRVLLV